jgi:chromosome partitioning protein
MCHVFYNSINNFEFSHGRSTLPAKILTIYNQKGGSAKTTTAMNTAGTIAMRGYRVLLVDADPQTTASKMANLAAENTPFPAVVVEIASAGSRLHQQLRNHVNSYDCIVVDTPPRADSPAAASALLVSDLGIIPTLPSMPDIFATVEAIKLIDTAKITNPDLQCRILISNCDRTNIAKELEDFINHNFANEEIPKPLFKTRLTHSTHYQTAISKGVTVHHLGAKAAGPKLEVNSLVDEILTILDLPLTKEENAEDFPNINKMIFTPKPGGSINV